MGYVIIARMRPDRCEREGPELIGARLPGCITPLQKEFYTSMLRGDLKTPSREQVEQSVISQFTYGPLVSLTTEEEHNLRQDAIEREVYSFGRPQWKLIAADLYYAPPAKAKSPGDIVSDHVFYVGPDAKTVDQDQEMSLLTPRDKEILFTDPLVFESAFLRTPRGGFGLYAYGTRNLTAEQQPCYGTAFFANDNYGYTIADFTNILSSVRKAQGKDTQERLLGLDLGGSNGLGAYNAEELDPNLNVTNITVTPELAFWPLRGGSRLLPAERLPAEFAEKFDLIISNFATPYMRYPELSLRNGLAALNRGGIMSIDFDFSRNEAALADKGMIGRIDAQFRSMEALQEEGYIRYLPLWTNQRRDAHVAWQKDPTDVHGQVFLQKIA